MVKEAIKYLRKSDVSIIDCIPILRSCLHPTDWRNRLNYGMDSPVFAETIYIDPRKVKGILIPRAKNLSSTVVSQFPPTENHTIIPIRSHGKISCCLEQWERGIRWSQTNYLSKQLEGRRKPNGNSAEKQDLHWSKYDKLLENLKRDGRLKSRREMNRWNFRENSGVMIHIAEDGSLYQGDSGNRRFAAALFAGLTEIPAQVGCVHVKALPIYRNLRSKSHERAS